MKPTNEQLFNDWIISIISRATEDMMEQAGEDECYRDGWINDIDWEIDFDVDYTAMYDSGDYWTPPYSEVTSYEIRGTLKIYDANGDTTEYDFKNENDKIELL